MAGQNDQAKPISLFYSYSHKDENLRRKLETHLAALRRGGLIAEWHDRKLEPGDAWKGEIDRHLTSADIVLLLVSADFINSDYCWGEEMAKALARHDRGEARVIPVILRYCHWQSTPLGRLQAAPKDGKPIVSWSDRDKAFHDVVAAIERAAHSARATPAGSATLAFSKPQSPDSEAAIPRPGTIFRDIEAPWCPELVVIPPGEFLMGSPDDDAEAFDDEKPQHQVRIGYSLAVGRYPVIFEEYDHFCERTRRQPPDDSGWGRGRRPVINVSWDDPKAYAEWLTAEAGKPYRLLTEAEWEYACRAGTTTRYWWGDEITPENANFGRNLAKTSEVGSYPASPFGLYDMHGNVWEWVEDRWHDTYEGAPEDGTAWLEGKVSRRVLRGGSWDGDPGDLRAACRCWGDAVDRDLVLGFRVARTFSTS